MKKQAGSCLPGNEALLRKLLLMIKDREC